MIDIEALKREWRRKAALHGVNVLEGVTVYTEANMKAQAAKEGHYERMATLVRAHAQRCPLKYDNGYGFADNVKVERQARRDWWLYTDYWVLGTPQDDSVHRHTERTAIRAIREVCKERDALHEREVFLCEVIRDLWMQEKYENRLEATRRTQTLDILYNVV